MSCIEELKIRLIVFPSLSFLFLIFLSFKAKFMSQFFREVFKFKYGMHMKNECFFCGIKTQAHGYSSSILSRIFLSSFIY